MILSLFKLAARITKMFFFSPNKRYVYAQIIAYNIENTMTKTSVGPL